MKCEEFETLLADALGDELGAAEASAFEKHIAQCKKCRTEYESLTRSLEMFRALPGPTPVKVERLGDRLVISPESRLPNARLHRLALATLRYAATILIAFVAGYAWHTESDIPRAEAGARGDAIGQRFVDIHAQNPQRSHFAKCLLAVTKHRH